LPIRIPTMKRASFLALTVLWAGPIAARGGQLELLTKVPPRLASVTASGESGSPALSADGRYLAFVSSAPNLAPGQIDDNLKGDVFLRDRITGAVTLVSHTAGSAVTAGDRDSGSPSISADGRWVAFESSSTDLVDGQIVAGGNVFLYDRLEGELKLVSHSRRSPRTSGNGVSSHPVLSADGRYVAFESYARDLINSPAGAQRANVFLYDRSTDKTVLVSHKAGSATADAQAGGDSPSVSADGRYVAFRSFSADLVPGQLEPYTFSRDVFVFDRSSGATLLASHAADSSVTAVGGDGPMISADGGDVVFASDARNLVAGQTGEGINNVFELHRSTGIVTLVSHASASPTQTTRGIYRYAVSADGGWVAFSSAATDLVPGQVLWGDPFSVDVFLWERTSRAVRLVSHAFGLPATEARGYSALSGISADGQRVLFCSEARDLVGAESIETEGRVNVYLYDRSSDGSALASYAGSGDAGGNDHSDLGVLSADGGWAAFPSAATDLARGKRDLNGAPDLFLFGRVTGELELVSRRDPGLPSRTPPAWSTAGDLSSDGRYAVFDSNSADLVPGVRDTNGAGDVFLYDRVLRKTTLVSRSAASPGQAANADSRDPVLSADGRYVLYQSDATDLVSGQVDETPGGSAVYRDLFLYDRVAGTTTLVSRSPKSAVAATMTWSTG
jgi:Tol biopolymer transport system component